MTQGTVELVREGHIATLRFANPPKHTLTASMVVAMHEQLAVIEGTSDVRVLVVRCATPNMFITHYEVGELAEMADQRKQPALPTDDAAPRAPRLHPLNELMLRLEALPCVTIAAMDGLAMGGGLELALGCDFRLLRDGQHVIGLPETSVGIIPGAGGTQRLARLLGVARALDVILHGALLTPKEALAAGIVHRVFASATFDADLAHFAGTLAARAPLALAQAKHAIRQGSELSLRDGLLLEQQAFNQTLGTSDARNAMRAYLKGQPYTFKGE